MNAKHISEDTRQLAERFRAASNALTTMSVKTTPQAEVEAVIEAYESAAADLALAVLHDIDRPAGR